MKYSIEELQTAYQQLTQKERPWIALGGAIGGAMPAAALYFVFGSMGGFYLWMLLLPAAIMGWFARFAGSPYQFKARVPVGVLAALLHLLGCWLLQLSPLAYLLAPVCAVVAISCAKINLSSMQQYALLQAHLGKLDLAAPVVKP
jgi:hypothetical protein